MLDSSGYHQEQKRHLHAEQQEQQRKDWLLQQELGTIQNLYGAGAVEEQLQFALAGHAMACGIPFVLTLAENRNLLDIPLFRYLQTRKPKPIHVISPAGLHKTIMAGRSYAEVSGIESPELLWLRIPELPATGTQNRQKFMENLEYFEQWYSILLQNRLPAPGLGPRRGQGSNSGPEGPCLLGLSISDTLLQNAHEIPLLQRLLSSFPLQLSSGSSPDSAHGTAGGDTSAPSALIPYRHLQAQMLDKKASAPEAFLNPEAGAIRAICRHPSEQQLTELLKQLQLLGKLSSAKTESPAESQSLRQMAELMPTELRQHRNHRKAVIGPYGWQILLKFCGKLACPTPDPDKDEEENKNTEDQESDRQNLWNGWGLLLGLCSGCSDFEAIYLAAPKKWQTLLQQYSQLLTLRSPGSEAGLSSTSKTQPSKIQQTFHQFSPVINARFRYISRKQLCQIPDEQRGSISIYDGDGNASGPYSCKRISDTIFQISNPYLGYQVTQYRLSGRSCELDIANNSKMADDSSAEKIAPPVGNDGDQDHKSQKKREIRDTWQKLSREFPLSEELSVYFMQNFCYPLPQKLELLLKHLHTQLEQREKTSPGPS
ncbi:hypothetical protein P0082_05195 [Candidatus Haliotispira prima]|uniref:Uncharacterized protein n=1 Tax=Candidatus Haliotispira prima TaxID=3034016 RepID=A0ABY8MKC2_9SPIO|nr:hypothetical protein P0082_05195 [Candidatus Haliotispira prima]